MFNERMGIFLRRRVSLFLHRLFAVLSAASIIVQLSAATVDLVQPVSSLAATGSSVTATGDSSAPLLSRDGRSVVFSSKADDLVTNDVNSGLLDVFVRKIAEGVTALVSVNTNGV